MGTHLRVLCESYPIDTNIRKCLDDFEKSLLHGALDESSLSIGTVKWSMSLRLPARDWLSDIIFPVQGRNINQFLIRDVDPRVLIHTALTHSHC